MIVLYPYNPFVITIWCVYKSWKISHFLKLEEFSLKIKKFYFKNHTLLVIPKIVLHIEKDCLQIRVQLLVCFVLIDLRTCVSL